MNSNINNLATSQSQSIFVASQIAPIPPPITASANSVALIDSGSSHILLHDDPIPANVTRGPHLPLTVAYNNGTQVSSVGSGTMPIGPLILPVSLFEPASLHEQLLGIGPFTNLGCEAHLTNTSAEISKDGVAILNGSKLPHEPLWTVHLPDAAPVRTPAIASGLLAVRLQSVQERVNYFSVLLGNPVDSSLAKALASNYLRSDEGWPAPSAAQLRSHAPNSPATHVGHIVELRHGLRSTKPDSPDASRPISGCDIPTVHVFPVSSHVHGDAKGPHPIKSARGATHILIMVYNNYIHPEPMCGVEGASMANAYQRGLEFFDQRSHSNHAIEFLRIDNTSSPHSSYRHYCNLWT